MADKFQQQAAVYPLAPVSVMPRSDAEYSGANINNYYESQELKRKKRLRCFAYIAAFAVFQTIIVVVFALTVMKVKTPRVRLEDVTFTNSTSSSMRFSARVIVRNRNFGHYKFDSAVGTMTSRGVTVSQFVIPEARARARSTKRVYVIGDVNLPGSTGNNGVLVLSAGARVRGKVELMKVLKRRKTATMNCNISVNLARYTVQNVNCS